MRSARSSLSPPMFRRGRRKTMKQMLSEETLICAMTEEISEKKMKLGVTNQMLASRMGIRESKLVRLMSGADELTVRDVAAMLYHLDAALWIEVRDVPRDE